MSAACERRAYSAILGNLGCSGHDAEGRCVMVDISECNVHMEYNERARGFVPYCAEHDAFLPPHGLHVVAPNGARGNLPECSWCYNPATHTVHERENGQTNVSRACGDCATAMQRPQEPEPARTVEVIPDAK